MNGTAQIEAGMTETLYKMPWSTMFPLGISSAMMGIAEGALAAHLDYQRDRVGAQGTAIKDDPYVLFAVGEAAADINAARQELLANVDRICDIVESGREVSFEDRAAGRRTQVRAAWRAVTAVDQIFARSGGNALRMDKPLQRYWRDAHAGLAHAIHVPSTVYHASALSSLGLDPRAAAVDDLRVADNNDRSEEPWLRQDPGHRPGAVATVRVRRARLRRGLRARTRTPCTCGWTSAPRAS